LITLRVSDDGMGISQSVSTNGMGLAIMRYRARLTGGELSVDRRKEGGTMVSYTFRPIAQKNEIAPA
jgi:nitrate/nitrite-specific signal transduction histidine kinase